jgi:DNA-binding transcriptional MerR regulator
VIAPDQSPLETRRDTAWNLEDFVAEVNTRLSTMLPAEYGDARQREDFTVRLLRHYSSLGLVDESTRVGREARYGYRHLLQVLCLRRLQRQGWNSKAIKDFTSRENPELEAFLLGQPVDPSSLTALESSGAKAELEEVSEISSMALDESQPLGAASQDLAGAAPDSARLRAKRTAPPESLKERALEFLSSVRKRDEAPKTQAPLPQAAPSQKMPSPAPLPQFLLFDPPKAPERWRRVEIAPGLELNISDRFQKPRTGADQTRLREALENALEG